MKKLPLVLVTLSFIISISSFAQVAIGTNEIEESAILKLESKEKGFLLPRMTNEERKKIENPAVGLQVFVTDFLGTDKGMILFYDGSEWKAFKELSSRPNPPTNVSAQYNSGDAAIITFDAPSSDGGTPISSYTVTSDKGGLSNITTQVESDNLSITITGLDSEKFYTFTVTATNKIGTSLPSASSNVVPAPQLYDQLYGGVVFYIFNSSDPDYVSGETHGLICAPENLESSYQWSSNQNNNVLNTEQRMGYGKTNTDKIISTLGVTEQDYAAYQATLYHLNEDGDERPWYLPSLHELNRMYNFRADINPELSNMNGSQFTDEYYWSSSQYSTDKAWRQNIGGSGTSSGHLKPTSFKVRPIRSF